jgi:manganese efflux pump family protein
MNFLSILLIALGLGMDALSVAVATGVLLRKPSPAAFFRMSFSFGFFQFMMPLIGWTAGRTVSGFIESLDHWVAFGLLLFVGGKMIFEAFREKEDGKASKADPTRGWTLLMLSIATSIDALAVGLSLAFLGESIFFPSVVIGIAAFAMTWVGMATGEKAGTCLGKKVEIAGGLILIGIGIKILVEHL